MDQKMLGDRMMVKKFLRQEKDELNRGYGTYLKISIFGETREYINQKTKLGKRLEKRRLTRDCRI